MELLEGEVRVWTILYSSLYFSSSSLRALIASSSLRGGDKDWEEWEKRISLSLSLSRSLALSPIRLEGSLVSALNATYRLECEVRAPWFIGKGEWIFIRNYEIVASLVLSFLCVYNRSRCTVVPLQSVVADSPRCPFLHFLCLSVSLMRWGHFFHTLRNCTMSGYMIQFIAETL